MKSWIPAILTFLVLISCEDLDMDQNPHTFHEGNVSVNTNSTELSNRLIEKNQSLNIDGVATSGRLEDMIELTLIAEILPPTINNQTVMATSINIIEDHFAVSYNLQGPEYRGGVDFIRKTNSALNMESQISLETSDVSSFVLNDNSIYYVGSSQDSDSTAFIDNMVVLAGIPEIESYNRRLIGGHASTSITMDDDYLYVTSGASLDAGGGLHILDKNNQELIKYIPIHDARWVEKNGSTIIVLSANPGKLTIMEADQFAIINEYSISGLNEEGYKSTFSIHNDQLFVASGYEGVHIFDLSTGDHLQNIPLPEGSSDLYALGVTVHDSIGFVAAGESVYLFNNNSDNSEILGRLELGNHQSINHLEYKDGFLAVASGLGGTKLIRVGNNTQTGNVELLANPNFDNGSDGWDLAGNIHYDPSWANETSIAFSGGNKEVTGVLSQEFSAVEGELATVSIDYFRRGNTTLEVFGVIEVIDLYDSSVVLSDSIITPHANGRIVDGTFMFTATSDRMLVKVTDHTENTISRDLYVTSLSIKQNNPPAQRIVKVSNFEEKEISNKWHQSPDENELSVNGIVSSNQNKYLHIKGTDNNGNGRVGGSWTRLARSAVAFHGYSPEEIYLNFDLKTSSTNGRLVLVTQANDADGVLRNWVINMDLDSTDWQRRSIKIADFQSNSGNFNGNVEELKVWSLSLEPYDSTQIEVKIDNIYYSTNSPITE